MDRREELARDEAQNDAGGKIVLLDTVSELEVLVEHGAQREGDRLHTVYLSAAHFAVSQGLKPHFEHYIRCWRGIVWVAKMGRNRRGISKLKTNAT